MGEPAERVPYKEGGISLAIGKKFVVELQAPVLRARLTGLLFDTSKSFLLPSAIHGMRALKRLFDEHKNLKILITGHTDRAGADAYNLKLSSERADSMSAYLRDAVDEWMKFYGQDISAEKRWGAHEDSLMIGQVVPAEKLEGGSPPPLSKANVEAFQRFSNETRGTSLGVDGKLGTQSRRALVEAYMKQPGTSLPDGVVPLTHGCGPFHNDVPTPPGVAEQRNRRAEIFFFEKEVKPPPRKPCPGPGGCPEYPEWLKSTTKTIDLDRGVGTLTVKVQKKGGGAIEGASVHLEGPFSEDGKTDTAGAAVFEDMPAGSYTVSAEQDGFDDQRATAELGDGSKVEVSLELTPLLFDLEVLVQDEAKNPLGDAVVEIDVKGVDPAKTDDKGIARFTGLQGGKVRLTAKHPGFKDGSVETPVPPPAAAKGSSGDTTGAGAGDSGQVPISLSGATGGLVVTVHAGSESGPAVHGAKVSLQPKAGGAPLEKTIDATSDKAAFTDVPAGKVLVSVDAKGFKAPDPVEVDVQPGIDQGKTIVLQSLPATLVVKVVDATPKPPALPERIGGATVRVLAAGSSSEQSKKTNDKADKDHGGEAKFENLPAGKASIRVQADGFAPGQIEAALTAGDVVTAEIALQPATGTVVVLVSDDLGAKVDDANVIVTLQPPGSAKARTSPTTGGKATFEKVPIGQSKIVAAKPGFADGEATTTLQADQKVEVPVAIKRRLAELTVAVVTPSGDVLSGATVVLERSADHKEAPTQASGETPPFKDLALGKWKISARLDNFTAPAPEEIELKDGVNPKRTITLTPNAVTAAIRVAAPVALPLVVVKKKGPCTPARKKITLGVANPFTGTGTGRFTRSKETIKFFTAATGGTELKFDGKDNVFTAAQLTAGKDLFAEGATTSASQQDTELRLELLAGATAFGTPASAKATCVELTADLFHSRTVTAGDPAKMSDADKLNPGRFVHVQDAGFHQGRAMIVVREVQPSGFTGSVRLQPIGTPQGKLKLFPTEPHKDGEAVTGPVLTPAQLSAATVAGAKGLALFAEGEAFSGGLRDLTLQLGLDGDEPDGDRIVFTVVQLTNLQAVVPSTRSPRTGVIPDHPAFTIAGTAADHFSEDFAANRPLVLMQNSVVDATPVKLSVTVQPNTVPISWSALRDTRPAQPALAAHANDGDDPGVVALSPKAVPTVKKTGATTATLLTDAVGSFRVRAFVNNNSTADFDRDPATTDSFAPDPFLLLNLVLVNVNLDHDDVQNFQLLTGVAQGGGGIRASSGVFNLAGAPNNTALHHNALCTIVGGGRNGRLGTDRVFGGWLQDAVLAIGHTGTYVDNTGAAPVAHQVPIRQENPRRGAFAAGTTPNVVPGDPAIAIFPTPPPILDSGRIGAGVGGLTACLGQSRITSRNNVAAGLGEQLRIEAVDSPAVSYSAVHPAVAAARLTFFHFQMDFRANLAFWTNNANPPNADHSGDPAEKLYVVALEVPWTMLGEWDINPGTGAVTVHGPAPAVSMPGNVVHRPAVAAEGLRVEPSVATGQTTWLGTWLRDATT